MLLGKRPRGQMKRTASVSGITVDLSHVEGQQPSEDQNPTTGDIPTVICSTQTLDSDVMNYTLSFVSPRGRKNLSPAASFNKDSDHRSSDHFLRSCTFCRRRLSPGRDIYMYMYDFLSSSLILLYCLFELSYLTSFSFLCFLQNYDKNNNNLLHLLMLISYLFYLERYT